MSHTLSPRWTCLLGVVLGSIALIVPARGQGFTRTNATSKLVFAGSVPVTDTDETDFLAVDVDKDGDLDVIIGRKEPFTTTGTRTNVLLMNRLNEPINAMVDETATLTSFNALSDNTRDVVSADMNNDTWPDLVVANTFNGPTEIHLNRGNDASGNWLGFDAPITFVMTSLAFKHCAVDAGDLNMDGLPDLYLGNYESAATDILAYQDASNPVTFGGNGQHFIDMTSILPSIPGSSQPFEEEDFTTEVIMYLQDGTQLDLNADGNPDVLVNSTQGFPSRLKVAYGDGMGGFLAGQALDRNATYSCCVGDFDGDGRLDVFKQNDGTDFWNRNLSTDANGRIVESASENAQDTSGLGANATEVDFDGDGDLDVIIHPIDVDITNCDPTGQRLKILENRGPGASPRFANSGAVYPRGTYDGVAVDLDGDCLPDLLTSACANSDMPGYSLWLSDPNGLNPACTTGVFSVDIVTVAPSSYELRVTDIPHPGNADVNLNTIFAINPPNHSLSGPVWGFPAETLFQLFSFAPPFYSYVPVGIDTYVFPFGIFPVSEVGIRSIAHNPFGIEVTAATFVSASQL